MIEEVDIFIIDLIFLAAGYYSARKIVENKKSYILLFIFTMVGLAVNRLYFSM